MADDESLLQLSMSVSRPDALPLLKLLADERRWALVQALRQSDRQVSELVAQTGLPQNLVSYHLGLLRQAGIVHVHRSDADGRAIYYALDTAALRGVLCEIAAALLLPSEAGDHTLPPMRVVFLCTGNSVRSQMAEAWLRHLTHGRLHVQSAGTSPGGIHPLVPQVMAEVGIDMRQHWSKGMEELTIDPDIVITVCDYAREECYPHQTAPVQLHWSIPTPERLLAETSDDAVTVFRHLRDLLRGRVVALLELLPTLQQSEPQVV